MLRKSRRKSILLVVLAVSVLLTVACAGGPGRKDVAAAVMAAYPGTKPIDGFKTEEVVKTSNGDYLVKVSYDTRGGGGPLGDPPGHYTLRLTMTKVGGNWRILRSELLGADALR